MGPLTRGFVVSLRNIWVEGIGILLEIPIPHPAIWDYSDVPLTMTMPSLNLIFSSALLRMET